MAEGVYGQARMRQAPWGARAAGVPHPPIGVRSAGRRCASRLQQTASTARSISPHKTDLAHKHTSAHSPHPHNKSVRSGGMRAV